jgi:hypothetical protein
MPIEVQSMDGSAAKEYQPIPQPELDRFRVLSHLLSFGAGIEALAPPRKN